ncbi:MAG: endonuclease/exonuclease/phosphatase family protein [Deltaproteobacteria bacterium]|nr:endonuclease/exonuclease/phosphatase family protein [Deltaproteobacteria bacterium]
MSVLPGRLRILSANLWNDRADADGVAALVERLAVDIAALQELGPRQAAALGRVMPHGVLEPGQDYEGMGIAARVPLAVSRLPLPCRDARICQLELAATDGTPHRIELINLHIRAPHSPPGWSSLQHRRGQWRGLQRHLVAAPQRPRLLVGDFNATPLWPFYRRVTAHLHDAARIVAARHGRRPRRTWGPGPGTPRLLRIDHAFVHRVAVLDFQVVDVPGGDHSAVVVDIAAE